MSPVTHQIEQSRFTAEIDGQTAFLSYECADGVVAMTHTNVPRELEGRGIAGDLTRTAVEWARAQGLTVDPQCSYVRSWLARNS